MRCVNRNLSLCRKAQLPTVVDDRCVAPSAWNWYSAILKGWWFLSKSYP